MMVLTDRPEAMTDLFAPPRDSAAWHRADGLDPATSELWEALGSGATAWTTEAPGDVESGGFWSRLILVANAPGSQFDLLRDQIAGPVRDVGPTACVALEGRNFHGHRGRPWQAAPGNLHLSAAWPTRLPAATWAACLSMLPAVAVVDAVTSVTNGAVRPGTKWVNDVLVPAGKLAGVLTATQVLGGDIDLVVFGVGLNVATAPQIEPTPFVPAAACLRECEGADHVTLGAVLRAVIDALASRLVRLEPEGPLPVWRDYVRSSLVVGRRVRVWDERATEALETRAWPAPIAAGVVTGIGSDLTLSIEGRAGPVAHGRLAFEEACAAFEAQSATSRPS